MRQVLVTIICCMFIITAGCGQGTQEPAQAPEAAPDYDAIRAQLEKDQYAYAEAWNNKDIEAIGRIWSHDSDITIWGPAVRKRVEGWEGPNGVKAWYEAAMGSMDTVDFKIHDLMIKVGRDGKSAVVTYYVENDFVDKDGNAGKMTPRVTVVKEIQNGEWRQIHGDASYSIEYMQNMK